MERTTKLAFVTTGLIGGVCWKYRKKIAEKLAGNCPGHEERKFENTILPSYTTVNGYWKIDRGGQVILVKPHYRMTRRRGY